MTIRRRTLLIMISTGLVLLSVIFAAERAVIMAGAGEIERGMVRQDLDRLKNAVLAENAQLAAAAGDWAVWDEMYAFAGAPSPAFAEQNITIAAFKNLDVGLIFLVDPAGKVLYRNAFDFERAEESPETAAAFAAHHAGDIAPLRPPDDQTARQGIVVLSDRVFLVASRSVLRSDSSGPSRGTLVFARLLDASAQARLARLTQMESAITCVTDPAVPARLHAALRGPAAAECAIETLGHDRIAGAVLLPDLSGRSDAVLRTVRPRLVHAQADRALRHFLLALLAAGAALGGLAVVLLERQVLAPLASLGAGVREIGRNLDVARRLPAVGNNELSALATEVNSMLEQIQASENELRWAREELAGRVKGQARTEEALRQSEERLRLVLESADELIFMQDLEGRCLYYNASRRLLSEGRDVGRSACELLDAGLGRAMFDGVQAVAANGRAQSGEIEVTLGGERKWFRRSLSPVPDASGSVTAVVTIAHDITAEKELREKILRGKIEWERTFDAVGDLIMLLDDQFRVVRVNRALAERFGVQPQILVGRACHDLLHGGSAPAAVCPFRLPAQEGKPHTAEMHVEALNGYFRVSVYPVRDAEGRAAGAVHVATDLTERRRAEEDLRLMYLMNQDILQRAPFGVFVVKATGEVEYVNPAMLKISGATEEQFRRVNTLKLRSYRDLGLSDRIREAAEGRSFFLGPVEHTSQFLGKRTTRNFTGFPLDLGKEKKALVFVEDLTELKKMEGALRTVTEEISALAGDAFFQEIVLTLSRVLGADAVFVGKMPAPGPEEIRVIAACIDGRIAESFDYRLAGTPCEGVMGKETCRHAEGVQARFPRDPLLARLKAESFLGIPLFSSSGEVSGLMAALWRRRLPDAQFAESLLKVFALRVATEIERAQAEETLRRTSALLRTIVLASPLPIVAVDAGRSVRLWNPAAEQLFGWGAEEVICRPAPVAAREHWEEFLNVLESGEDGGGAEHRLARRKDGILVEVDVWSAPLEEQGEDGVLRLVVFADMTETRMLQRQLLRAQRMEVVGKLAAGLAHEVRNPLNAIMAVSDALAQDLGANPEYQPFLHHIRTQVNRLATLMEDLLSFGRPIAQERFSELSLEGLCREAAALWLSSHPAGAPTVRIVTEEGARDQLLWGDGERLTQVLFNLLENATQHSPHGSGILVAMRGPAGSRCRIEVMDRGTGITLEAAERLFEPFFSTRKGGTGLGLSIVRNILEAHGGSIQLRNNEPGPGCTAEVSLPCYGKEGA